MDTNSIVAFSVGALAVSYMLKLIITLPRITLEEIYGPLKLRHLEKEYQVFSYKGHHVHIRPVMYGTDLNIRIYLKHKLKIYNNFLIRKESTATRSKKIVGIDDIITGDKYFDTKIYIKGSKPESIIPLLNGSLRKTILQFSKETNLFELTEDSLRFDIPLLKLKHLKDFYKFLDTGLKISLEITGERKLKKRLLKNIVTENNPETIIKNIDILTTRFIPDSQIRKTLKETMTGSCIEVSLYSSRHLGRTGTKYLYELLTADKLEEDHLIQTISAVKYNYNKKLILLLMQIYREKQSKKTKSAIIDTIETADFTAVEVFLSEQLDSAESELKIKIIEAFGLRGSKGNIEKLYRLGKDSEDQRTKRAIENSIEQIQARMGNVDSGWLTVAKDDVMTGSLSISKNSDKGALSLMKDPEEKK